MIEIQQKELPAFSGEDQPRRNYVLSQTHNLYKSFMPKRPSISLKDCRQMFNANNISYNPTDRYESFSYEVGQQYRELPFYRVHIKIAHFSLVANVIKVQDNNYLHGLRNGNNGSLKIGFQSFMGDQICIKRLSFKDQDYFQHDFRRCIKQWAILKICSAMRCGPYMKNYFGFDILIYDHFVEFFCERGEKINNYSLGMEEDLKDSLSLLHYFKIVHLDIKPQNTIYSLVYNRAVFIDFGFSEIVSEECGYRTSTIFKGTPNFCCPEMLAIMNQDRNYVDLYYNDAYGLSLVVKYLQMTSKTLVEQFHDFDQQEAIIEPQDDTTCTQLHYFITFQYQYLMGGLERAREILSRYMKSCKNNPYRVFKFIKKVIKQRFWHTIFYQDLKQFSKMAEYAEITQKIKVIPQKFHLQSKQEVNSSKQGQNQLIPLSYDGRVIPTQDFIHYQKLILQLSQFQSETVHNYLAIAFNSIRFDIRNHDFSSKVLMAGRVRKLLASYMGKTDIEQVLQSKTQIEGLRAIQGFLLQLFDFCLKTNNENWAKDRIFDIFQNFILLDINVSQHIDEFILYVNMKFQSATEHALASFQTLRLLNSIKIIATRHIKNNAGTQRKLKDLLLYQENKLIDINNIVKDREIQQMCTMLQVIQKFDKGKNIFLLQDLERCPGSVKNQKVRRYLDFFLIYIRLQLFFNSLESEPILFFLESIQSSQLFKLDFFSLLSITHKMILIANGMADLPQYCSYMKSIINCQTIFERIQIAFMGLLNQINLKSLNLSIDYFLNKYQFQTDYQKIQEQLLTILIQVSRLPFSPDYLSKLRLLYPIYKKLSQNVQVQSERNYKSYLTAYSRIQIQYIYYYLGEDKNDLFLYHRALSQSQLQSQLLAQQQNKDRRNILQFQFTMYQFKLMYYQKKYASCIKLLSQLINLCLQYKMVYIVLQLYFHLHEVCMILKDDDAIYQAIMALHHFCFQQRFTSFYLLPTSFEVSLTTFAVFARHHKDRLRKILIVLAKFVQLHPLKCYIRGLVRLCHHFLWMYPQNQDVFHSYSFDQQLAKNPYMVLYYIFMIQFQREGSQMQLFKKIARNTDELIGYAKKLVLDHYFSSYFEYRIERNARKTRYVFRFAKFYVMNRWLKKEKIRQLLKPSFPEYNSRLRRAFNKKKQRMIKIV